MKRGLFIPAEIWEDGRLSAQEKLLLAKIAEFEKNGKPCFLSNAAIGEMLGVKVWRASDIVTRAIEKGYIYMPHFDGKNRILSLCKTTSIDSEKPQTKHVKKHKPSMCKTTSQACVKPQDNSINITSTPTESLLKEKTTTSSTPAFVPPSIEMVLEYVKPLGMKDPEGFARYYVESQTDNGWTRRDRNKMVPVKDWKNNVRQWIPNHMTHTFPKPVPAQAPAPVTKSEERIFTKADLTTGVLPADMPREMRQYLAFGGTAKFANDTWIKI